MTVSYTSQVITCSGVGGSFLKLLGRWKGSVYKIVWSELILYLFIYYCLNLSYNYAMDARAKSYFEEIVQYFSQYGSLIPVSFVLGFYIDVVMERWWDQYSSIPFPDNLAIIVGASIQGQDVKSRAVKRTIVRYACTTFTITSTMISSKVKKRFPTLDHLIEAGLINKEEKKIIEELDNEYTHTKYWLPLAWASNIVIRARQEGLIRDDECVEKILDALNDFRDKCARLLDYDWISVPLVYTQVVTIAVYSYFLISVIGNQHINGKNENIISSYFPLLPVMEFFFYMGWLKVAETLVNPFGDDDDDFEIMWMVDRHIQVVFLLVDKIPQKIPKLTKDRFWNDSVPVSLPFTKASADSRRKGCPIPSTENIKLSELDREIVVPQHPEINTYESGGRLMHKAEGEEMRNIPFMLKSVTIGDNPDSDEIDENIEHNDDVILKKPPPCEVFEDLRRRRQEERTQKLNHYLSILANGSSQTER
ncbi:bestrophin-2-like [Coccinella septempunctata]|uniref:bestrophin-2-like n=1 Tax=Coccinella septempunctata TaxID=41139 RepID=UPI001D091E20|nr:bestrophin-2-like [Coccinella septempunctata]